MAAVLVRKRMLLVDRSYSESRFRALCCSRIDTSWSSQMGCSKVHMCHIDALY